MNEILFKNIAYCYYPKGINAVTEKDKYINSSEFERLYNVINYFKKQEKEVLKLRNEINILFNAKLVNMTSFEHFDRSFCFKINYALNNSFFPVYIYISCLIPRFLVVTEEENKTDSKLEIERISNLITQNLALARFPLELSNKVIERISFGDIKEGDFTFFNAFFSDIEINRL